MILFNQEPGCILGIVGPAVRLLASRRRRAESLEAYKVVRTPNRSNRRDALATRATRTQAGSWLLARDSLEMKSGDPRSGTGCITKSGENRATPGFSKVQPTARNQASAVSSLGTAPLSWIHLSQRHRSHYTVAVASYNLFVSALWPLRVATQNTDAKLKRSGTVAVARG